MHELNGCAGVVEMGRPQSIVCGNVCMHMSTCGQLVKALLPKKDMPSLIRVLAEVTQNVMDWAFCQGKSLSMSSLIPGVMAMT